MIYSAEEKRKIILDNYAFPSKQISLEELKKQSEKQQSPLISFRSLDEGCGDVVYLLVVEKNGMIVKCLFSGQQSCLVTVAAANMLCTCLEGKKLDFAKKVITNCKAMIENKEYNLNDCSDLQVFSDIFRFPNRLECIKLVIRAIVKTLK